MSKLIAQEIIDEVQAVADSCQFPAFRYEVRNGKTFEIRAYPKPSFEGERQPIPTPDTEGHIHSGNGRISRCVAVAVDLASKEETTRLFSIETEKDDKGVERPTAVLKSEYLRAGEQRKDGTLAPDSELREWANASRRRSVRRYGDDFVPIEYRWVDVDEDVKVGKKPEIIERDDIDIQT